MDDLILELRNAIEDKLITRKDLLQAKLNDLLLKGGVISAKDKSDTYELIRQAKEQSVADMFKSDKKRLIISVLVGAIAIYGIYYAIKK
jgi:hypothetical protein